MECRQVCLNYSFLNVCETYSRAMDHSLSGTGIICDVESDCPVSFCEISGACTGRDYCTVYGSATGARLESQSSLLERIVDLKNF